MTHPLDNPAWHALAGPQREFGRVGRLAARYLPNVSPIAALADESDAAFAELASMTAPGEIAAVISERGFPARDWEPLGRIPLRQWLHDGRAVNVDDTFEVLGAAHAADMYALAKLADPGPFEQDTWRLGTYLGVQVDGTLVAMAGERMRLPGFAEVSAVSTRPGHEGHGYATRLVRALVAREWAAGERPFLHVRTGSPAEHAASRVYEKLGFEVRVAFTFQLGRRRDDGVVAATFQE